MKMSCGEKIFSVFNNFFLAVVSLAAVYPFIYVLVCSFSSKSAIDNGKVFIFPVDFNLGSYTKVIGMNRIWMGYFNTLFYTVIGTAFSLLITICGAYPLSKKRLFGRRILSIFVMVTMYISAGLIPTYLNIRSLGLINTRTAIIVAFSCTAFYVFLMESYFQSIPDSLEESAKIDGANDIIILLKIVLPLSTPALATLALFYAVSRWNGWFWASIILTDVNKIPLQVYLMKLVTSLKPIEDIKSKVDSSAVSYQTILYATIVVGSLPIIIVYPFIQKFFVKGILVGSVKE